MEASEPLFPEVGMMVSPSDLSLSTKLSTSFPLAPSLSALLGPLGLEREREGKKGKGQRASFSRFNVSLVVAKVRERESRRGRT